MALGKVSGTILKRSVVNLIGEGPRTAVDSAVLATEGKYILAASETGLCDNPASSRISVYKAANNIWAAGGTLRGIEGVFMLPEKYKERWLKELTRDVLAACRDCGVSLMGGHTEVSDAVTRPCVTITAIGDSNGEPFHIKNVQPGMELIVTKWIGLEEASYILSNPGLTDNINKRFSQAYLDEIRNCISWLTIKDEAAVAVKHGAAAMHDISDGGIFGALWEFCEGAGLGMEIDLKAIPVRQEIIELTTFLGMNLYRVKSSGSLLIAAPDGETMVKALREEGIPAAVIGKLTSGNDKILHNDDEIRYLEKA